MTVVQQQRERDTVGHSRRRLEESRRDTHDVISAGIGAGHDDEDAGEDHEGSEAVARQEVHDECVLARTEETAQQEDEQDEAIGYQDEGTLYEHRDPGGCAGHHVVYSELNARM